MEIKTKNADTLIIDDNPFLQRVLLVAIGLAGFSLFLGSIKEYGLFAYYRFTYVMSILMAITGSVGLIFFTRTIRMTFNKKENLFKITHLLAFKKEEIKSLPLDQISNVSVEKKSGKNPDTSFYRLALKQNSNGKVIPNERYKRDFHSTEQIAKSIQLFLKKS